MKAHIFLIANLKFRLQTPCSFGDTAENVKLIGIPINNFLCIYIITSSPGLHTLFCLWRVNKKLPQGETSQNTFQRSRSISWKCKIHMVKWAYPPLIKAQESFPELFKIGKTPPGHCPWTPPGALRRAPGPHLWWLVRCCTLDLVLSGSINFFDGHLFLKWRATSKS